MQFQLVGGQATETYRFITGFYGLTDLPAEFQKAIDNTPKGLRDTFFLDDIIIVSGGAKKTQKEKVFKCLQKHDKENLSKNLEKCDFAKKKSKGYDSKSCNTEKSHSLVKQRLFKA